MCQLNMITAWELIFHLIHCLQTTESRLLTDCECQTAHCVKTESICTLPSRLDIRISLYQEFQINTMISNRLLKIWHTDIETSSTLYSLSNSPCDLDSLLQHKDYEFDSITSSTLLLYEI